MENVVEKDVFVNVYGYEDVEKELKRVREWLTDPILLNNPKIMIPKGVIFYGRTVGNGKTTMLRDFANSFNAPIYVIDGKEDNTSYEISEVFDKAREENFAIVLIDEIDLLLEDRRTVRVLQQEMDGVNTKGSILVLATTNYIDDIPNALLRPGRFDKLVFVDNPSYESRIKMIEKFVKELDVDTTNIDFKHVAKACSHCSGAELKAVCNDCYLRCKANITTEELEVSYERVVNKNYSNRSIEYKNYKVAIHEASHALMALRFKDNWAFYSAKFNTTGGVTEIHDVDENVDTVSKREQNIMIGLSGYIGEEVIYGKHEVGSYNDYNKVNDMIERLIERVCIKGTKYLIPTNYLRDSADKHWSDKKVKMNEKMISKYFKKYERLTKSYLKRNKKLIIKLADYMYEHGSLSLNEANKLIED